MLRTECSARSVGSLFVEQAQRKVPGVDKAALDRIAEVSRRLAAARMPAFYLERRYGEVEARRALADARFVLEWVEGHMSGPHPG